MARNRGDWQWLLCLGIVVALFTSLVRAGDKKGPSKMALSGAEHYLEKFEAKVKRMRGQPFKLRWEGETALKRVAALHKDYPDDPKVKELFERARVALIASKGEVSEVTKDALVYLENKDRLRKTFLAVAEKEWQAFRLKALEQKGAILKPFPPPSHRDVDLSDMTGRYVFLEDFE